LHIDFNFETTFYAPRKNRGERIVAELSVRSSVRSSRIRVRPITLLFEVGFHNYFTEMINKLRRSVTHNIWVVTLFNILNFVCDITLTLKEVYLPVFKIYSGSITPALVRYILKHFMLHFWYCCI
jgi:hypothetical protein